MPESNFVSRAGLKLEQALKEFKLSVQDLVCADFGCNLGGFTDCLLQSGAKKIYSVDTSKNCLEWNLRNNPKVTVLEQTNAMHVELPEKMDLIVSDVAWTKQEKILPAIKLNLKDSGLAITLIKPHYESKREELHRGKVKEEFLEDILERTKLKFKENGFELLSLTKSPITGRSGKNTEYLALLKLGSPWQNSKDLLVRFLCNF
jgi:23S rRNA (cytidine1920-2'-O)/16S rRNA (cytidine1409-2'-O)-methyltransferase